MLQCCIQCSRYSEMHYVYRLATSRAHPEPDIVTHSTYIKGLCKFKKIVQALDLYHNLR